MPFLEFNDFAALKAQSQPIMALDHGSKVIGVAISDSRWVIGSPHSHIENKKFTTSANEIFKIAEEKKVIGILMGLPLNMDGSENIKCQSIRQFGRNLTKIKDINIHFFDERFSSTLAENALLETGMSWTRKDELIDKVAAGYILQSFLDKVSSLHPDIQGKS